MRVALLLVILLACGGPAIRPTPVPTPNHDEQCIGAPPPVPPAPRFRRCSFGDRPACLDDRELLDLIVYLDESARWQRNAWVHCRGRGRE